MKNINLYKVAKEVHALEEMLITDEGEITEATEDRMNYVKFLIQDQTDGIVEYATMLKDRMDMSHKREMEFKAIKKEQKNNWKV